MGPLGPPSNATNQTRVGRPHRARRWDHFSRRNRRRNGVFIAMAVMAVGAFFVAGLIAWSQAGNQEGRNAQQSFDAAEQQAKTEQKLRNEIDRWSLPDTVMRSPGGAFNLDLGDTVTRSFAAQGAADTQRAAEDFVAVLHEQGYQDLATTGDGEWAGQCQATSSCRLSIWVDSIDHLIVVELRA